MFAINLNKYVFSFLFQSFLQLWLLTIAYVRKNSLSSCSLSFLYNFLLFFIFSFTCHCRSLLFHLHSVIFHFIVLMVDIRFHTKTTSVLLLKMLLLLLKLLLSSLLKLSQYLQRIQKLQYAL